MAHKVVIIDDSEAFLGWARASLAAQGFQVEGYSKPFGIVAFIAKQAPDLVLLDLRMTSISGSMLCKVLKDHPSTKNIVALLYSSTAEGELQAIAEECKADGYVIKTNDSKALGQALRNALTAHGR